MTEVFAGILILVMMLVLYYFGISFFETMEHLSNQKGKYKIMETKPIVPQETIVGVKKDAVAAWSFAFGLVSIPFAFVGIIPLAAIALGIWGINRTKAEGTGRWMAVAGLVLGVVYLISNAYMNGHFG